MKLIYIIYAFCFLIVSCSRTKKAEDYVSDKDFIYISQGIQRTINIDVLFDFAGIIPLETCESSLIGEITKLVFYNDHFFILDNVRLNLLVFCNEGRFVKKIGGLGKGPGEFVHPVDFTINEDNGDIIILDFAARKLMVWDEEGVFIEQVQLNFPAIKFEIHNDNYLFHTNRMLTEHTLNYEVIVTDDRGKIEKRFIEYSEEDILRIIPENVFSKNQNEISIFTCFNDTVWAYSNDNLYPRFIVNFENPIPLKYTQDYDLFNTHGINYSFLSMHFLETDDLIYFNYIDNKQIKGLLIDKDNGERVLFNQLSNKSYNQEYFQMPKFVAGKYLVAPINNIFDWEFDTGNSEIIADLDVNRGISDLITKRDESSNPVLVLLKFKGIPSKNQH